MLVILNKDVKGKSVKEIWQDFQIVTIESIRKICKRLSWKNI